MQTQAMCLYWSGSTPMRLAVEDKVCKCQTSSSTPGGGSYAAQQASKGLKYLATSQVNTFVGCLGLSVLVRIQCLFAVDHSSTLLILGMFPVSELTAPAWRD